MTETSLTARQLEIAKHLANGMRVEEVALELHLSSSTVDKTIGRMRKKIGARTVAHLVSILIAQGDLVWIDDISQRDLPAPLAQTA